MHYVIVLLNVESQLETNITLSQAMDEVLSLPHCKTEMNEQLTDEFDWRCSIYSCFNALMAL
jgi:hypothetical protein